MRDRIEATLCDNHFLKCPTYSIARNGEGLTPCLSVSIPERLCKYWAYIDFKKANGETFKTPRIDIVEGVLSYEIDGAVLDVEGKLEVQIIFQNENNEIWKSYVKEFAVRYSINATDDIPDQQDFITEAQKILDEAVETANSVEKRANAGEFKGDKGDKGDAGSIEFVVVAELPDKPDESIMYLVPNTEIQEQNTYDEYIYTNGAWEKIGSASVEVDLTEYVKTTDYATYDKLGIVKANLEKGTAIGTDGTIQIYQASNYDIEKKNNSFKPITPYRLDHAVKVGLTTNTETLTNEEKAQAQSWLGITDLVGDIESLLGGI